jgi:hypothetical protein
MSLAYFLFLFCPLQFIIVGTIVQWFLRYSPILHILLRLKEKGCEQINNISSFSVFWNPDNVYKIFRYLKYQDTEIEQMLNIAGNKLRLFKIIGWLSFLLLPNICNCHGFRF